MFGKNIHMMQIVFLGLNKMILLYFSSILAERNAVKYFQNRLPLGLNWSSNRILFLKHNMSGSQKFLLTIHENFGYTTLTWIFPLRISSVNVAK